MASNYVGNATASETPSPPPGSAYNTTLVLPADSDGATWGNTYQPFKTLADRTAFQQKSSNAFLPQVAANGTGYTAVTQTGSGTGTVAPSGTVLVAGGRYFAIKMIVGGPVGTATFQSSLDGGITYGATQTTAASMTDATIGVTLAWSGTFNATDVYQFTSGFTPQAQWKNSLGNVRSLIDHNGLATRAGGSQVSDEWAWGSGSLSAGAQAGTPWTVALGSASALSIQSPTASYNARFLQFTPSVSSGGQTLIYSPPLLYSGTSTLCLVLEFEFGMSIAGITSNVSWFVGLGATTNPSTDNSAVMIAKQYNSANYFMTTGNGSVRGYTDAQLAPVVGAYPTDRFKVELHGAGSPYSAQTAFFFINGNFIGAQTNLPSTALRLICGSSNDGGSPSGPPIGYLGPVFMTWNRLSSVSL